MSSTNKTANYELPQFIGTDKPTWLGDINQAMSIIDGQMKTNANAAASATGEVSELNTRVTTAENNVSALNTRVKTVEGQASNLSGDVSTLNTAVEAIIAQLNLNQFTQNTISLGGNRSFTVYLAQNSAGSLFKFYGHCYIDNNSSSSVTLGTHVSIPGSTGLYGIASGLYLNSHPSKAYTIAEAGYNIVNTRGYNQTTNGYMNAGNFFTEQIVVGSDGQIYVSISGNNFTQTPTTFDAYTRNRVFWLPMLYWNGDFGDEPGE